jgi:methionyl-tRNA formyltransferase
LLDHGVDVRLVFTHRDSATERAWFGSVAQLAAQHGIEVVTPEDPNAREWVERTAALAPEYLLSFYYRSLLRAPLRGSPRWGALNMPGSLLPKYRGRAPVNWAIMNGESECGATLHYMVEKPDAGPIIAQERVPIGIDDTALAVSLAVAEAAARLLTRCLPQLRVGPPEGWPMNLAAGSYFGGRRPEDGRIDWSWPAARVHALIRAVAPPFPGAFAELESQRVLFALSRWTGEPAAHPQGAPCLYVDRDGRLYLDCRDGLRLEVPSIAIGDRPLDAEGFTRLYGRSALPLGHHSAERTIRS